MKKPEKKAVKRSGRIGALVIAAALLGLAIFGGYQATVQRMATEENTLYGYTMSAGSSYKVQLKPNELYPEGALEEGRLYARDLIDSVKIAFDAKYTGTQPAQIGGNYKVEAVVQGYQSGGEGRRVIYERRYPLINEKPISGTNNVELSDSVSIQLNPYREFADKAEQLLGSRPSRELLITFSGVFLVETEFGEVEEAFSQDVSIPLTGDLFSIAKPEPVSKQDKIAESKEVPVRPNYSLLIPSVACLMIGVAVVMWTLLYTRRPNEEEQYQFNFQGVVRKHGSRMVRLESRPVFLDRDQQAVVADLNDLVKLSDEIQRPICYYPDAQGTPANQLLYVPDGDGKVYLLYYKE